MLGFLKGKIHVKLEKRQFTPGETIKGTVRLELNKEVQATALQVQLYATKQTRSQSSSGKSTRSDIFYDFVLDLDGERTYQPSENNEYPFEITIPNRMDSQNLPDNVVGDLVKVMQFFSKSSVRVDWYVKAYLDIPWSIDISDKISINVI